jgi:flagellar motility protein MotE (MotC chaperone)
MVSRLPLPTGARRLRRERRSERLLASRAVREALVSIAGLIGRPVRIAGGAEVGRVADCVARWDGQDYPPLTGLVVRVGRRPAFVPVEQVLVIDHTSVSLSSARFDLRGFERRSGEVLLAADVLDHQLVDRDGVRVVRASDLYLARVGSSWRLVGVDVSLHSLLRRLGPARWRTRPTPDRVVDWAAIEPFGIGSGPLRLRDKNDSLSRLRPSDLADLLEELGRSERQELLDSLEPASAADALEEMEPQKLRSLLRDLGPARAAELIAEMEPDEAIDALRELDDRELAEVFAAMPPQHAPRLRRLLQYPEDSAGGLMTTRLVHARVTDSVDDVRERIRIERDERVDIDAVVLVDDADQILDDVAIVELLVADHDRRMSELASPNAPITVTSSATLTDVIDQLIASRRSSVVVVDDQRRPIGRILADDVIDALVPERGRRRMPIPLP